ncbi:nucleotide sugar dehydrogenase [Podospora fimiseda]|uniref:Nucleotide sugar dehydrogenase n=1 Tax=Podospora fimiseda TaxID=252190 RepID=A0AAN6YRE2_9PEZI|nr:nucleotide sugar dehydrogenase [Podospora fimiseda]
MFEPRDDKPWVEHDEGYWTVTPSGSDVGSDVQTPGSITHQEKSVFSQLQFVPLEASPVVAIMGIGYVGLNLVQAFSSQYEVVGFDILEDRIAQVSQQYQDNTRVRFTTNPEVLADATHILISVPTLLLPDNTIDSSYLRSALSTVGVYARPGSTVVIESSVAVGMTRELLGPLTKQRGFFAGMSPERVDPGRTMPLPHEIPKIISGLDDVMPGSLSSITRLYSPVFSHVVSVSKPEVAEMTKLYENCQRMVCIAYANEMADACIPHGIDPFEVANAAATKPFGYMPYTPSLGVGGHCIPVNPYYLLYNSQFPLLEQAAEKMKRRPEQIAQRILDDCGEKERESGRKAKVLVVGVGFKRGQSNLSYSPSLALLRKLNQSKEKVQVMFADPLVSQDAVPDIGRLDPEKEWNRDKLQEFDRIVVAFRQVGLDFDVLQSLDGVKVETWCN